MHIYLLNYIWQYDLMSHFNVICWISLFFIIFIFSSVNSENLYEKILPMITFIYKPLTSEAFSLPTEPQPLYNSHLNVCFEMGHPQILFVYFCLLQSDIKIYYKLICKTVHLVAITENQTHNLLNQSLTTRPGLPSNYQFHVTFSIVNVYKCISTHLSMHQLKVDSVVCNWSTQNCQMWCLLLFLLQKKY